MSAFSEDRFLDGRINVRQPIGGFRSGLDAVILAAAIPDCDGGEMLELGAGAGAAALCVASRLPSVGITAVEIDAELVALAADNARRNAMGGRVRFEQGDVLALQPALKREFAHVFANPPFHGSEGLPAPDEARRRARQDFGTLAEWLETGVRRTASGGTFTTILRADRLGEALAALPPTGVLVFPLWPRAGEPAKRILLQIRKAARSPLMLQPGLVLHDEDGHFTPQAEAIFRGRTSLALGQPRL